VIAREGDEQEARQVRPELLAQAVQHGRPAAVTEVDGGTMGEEQLGSTRSGRRRCSAHRPWYRATSAAHSSLAGVTDR
jgi:hypothetical protein